MPHGIMVFGKDVDVSGLAGVNKRAPILFTVGEEANQLHLSVCEIEKDFRFIMSFVSEVLGFALEVLDVVPAAHDCPTDEKSRAGVRT